MDGLQQVGWKICSSPLKLISKTCSPPQFPNKNIPPLNLPQKSISPKNRPHVWIVTSTWPLVLSFVTSQVPPHPSDDRPEPDDARRTTVDTRRNRATIWPHPTTGPKRTTGTPTSSYLYIMFYVCFITSDVGIEVVDPHNCFIDHRECSN